MNKLFFVTILIQITLGIKAQNLDRVSLTSGGMVNNKMNVVIGELFVFTTNNTGELTIETGSLGSTANTGGINQNTASIIAILSKHKVCFYPNPVIDELTFSVDNLKNTPVTVKVIDISGKIVLKDQTYSPESTTINVSKLTRGQYIVELKSSDNTDISTFKFIKQ